MQGEDAVGRELLQLLPVDVVYLLVPAAEVEVGLPNGLALLLLPGTLLDEAAEGCEAGAGTDHDHRGLRPVGQPELRASHVDWDPDQRK